MTSDIENELKTGRAVLVGKTQEGRNAEIIQYDSGIKGVWKNWADRDLKKGANLYRADRGQYELAAYAVDRKLGLNMVPVTVERNLNGEKGTVQLFVGGFKDREGKQTHPT